MSSYQIVEHTVPGSYIREYPRGLASRQEDVPRLAVKQYIPVDNPNPQPGDVTIIAAHANGFPKELYEPLWDGLAEKAKDQGWRIRSIWIADVTQQGASSILNEQVLGDEPSWFDHSRDLFNLINLKSQDMPRPLIGIGHSFGGNQLTNLSLMHPRLFTSLVLIDPIIWTTPEKGQPLELPIGGPAAFSSYRRAVWPSRQAAADSFQKSPFYKTWNPRVLDLFIKYGLREGPTILYPELKSPQVTLTTPPAHEVHTFYRQNYKSAGAWGNPHDRKTHADVDSKIHPQAPFYRPEGPNIHARLPNLRPSAVYIFGGKSDFSNAEANSAKVALTGTGVGGSGGIKEGRVEAITLDDVGHLVAMEAVEQTADVASKWIHRELRIYKEDQKEYEEWTKKSLTEKQQIDDQWKEFMPKPTMKSKKPKPKESKI